MNSLNSLLTSNTYNGVTIQSNNPIYSSFSNNSGIEQAIRTSSVPISSNESEEVNALGNRGVLLNKNEIQNWRGTVPIDRFKLNDDPNPEVITKSSSQPIEYNQDVQIKWLRPPSIQPGDIVIKRQADTVLPAAPPLVVRQHAPEPPAPETSKNQLTIYQLSFQLILNFIKR